MTTPEPEYADGGVIFHNPESTGSDAVPEPLSGGCDYILRADATDDQDDSDELALEVPPVPTHEPVSWESYENGQGGWSFRPVY